MNKSSKIMIGSTFLIGILIILTPFANPNPDGLESAAGKGTFEGNVLDLGFLTGYGSEGSLLYNIVQNEALSVILSGLLGVLMVTGLFLIPVLFVRRKNASSN